MIIEFWENDYGKKLFPSKFFPNNNPTNGDIINLMFPRAFKDYTDIDGKSTLHVDDYELEVDDGWWNAPYKRIKYKVFISMDVPGTDETLEGEYDGELYDYKDAYSLASEVAKRNGIKYAWIESVDE